jgi:ABC-type Fe3+-siderophore transport system permease subunit
VNADGSGVITLTEVTSKVAVVVVVPVISATYAYQASKDLNTLMLNEIATNSLGMALRK